MAGYHAFAFRRRLLCGAAAIALLAASPEGHSQGHTPGLMPFGNVWVDLEGRFNWINGTRQPWVGFLNQSSPDASITGADSVRPSREYGGRFAFGMRFSADVDIAFAYTGLYSNTRRRSVSSGYGGDGAYIAPILGAVRYILGNTYYGNGYVKTRRQMHIGDFEVGHHIGLGSRATLRLFGGARVVSWQQKTDTVFNAYYPTPLYIAQTAEQHRSSFFGGGPRLGVNGTLSVASLGSGEILLFGNVAGSILLGEARRRIRTTFTVIDDSFFDLPSLTDEQTDSSFRVVYNTEASLAAGYRLVMGGLRLTFKGGYRFDGWWNMVDTRGTGNVIFAGPVAGSGPTPALANQFGTKRGYLLTHGPFGTLTVEF